jgi:MFS family permease
VLAGIAAMSGNGVSFAAVAERAGGGRAGTALGLQNTVLAVAVTAAPPLFGAAVGALTWPGAFAAAALCPLAGWWLLGVLAREEGARARASAAPP